MNISFIGSGKVGTAFGKYISGVCDVRYYYNRTYTKAEKSAEFVGCLATDQLKLLIEASDIIFVTTSDDAIKDVSKEISDFQMDLSQKHFVHMSGALTTSEFENLVLQGASCSSLHPLQTFATIEQGYKALNETYFALESKVDDLLVLLKRLGNTYFRLSQKQKTTYHLSACVFSNYLVTLFNMGSRLLESIGIEESEGLDAMKPLVDATLNNIFKMGTKEALTGPIRRGDINTLIKHMKVLDDESLGVYKMLGTLTTEHLIDDEKQKLALRETWRS